MSASEIFIFIASYRSSGLTAELSNFIKFGNNFMIYYLYSGCSAIGLSYSHKTFRLGQYVKNLTSANSDIKFLRKYSSASFFNYAKSFKLLILFKEREQISILGI